jgi:hypothetical protein
MSGTGYLPGIDSISRVDYYPIKRANPKLIKIGILHVSLDAGAAAPVWVVDPVATGGGVLRPGKLTSPGSLGPEVNWSPF